MAESTGELADRVFEAVLAPLVLGGPMQPSRPIGARAALALAAEGARPSDADLASRVDLARVRCARRVAPIDRVGDPGGPEWAMGAALHDLLQVASPSWVRRSGPRRLVELVNATLARIPAPTNARDALARHTWFARLFAIERTDTSVSWWVGTREFRGEPPPKRLLLWPEVRRVSVDRAARGLTELLPHGGATEHAPAFAAAIARLLRATPLTDFATCTRATPAFAWSPETLALVQAPVARTLTLRALARAPSEAVDAALGHATRVLLTEKRWKGATTALELLAHRAFAGAQGASWPEGGSRSVLDESAEDAAFARAAGAMVARRWLDEPGLALPDAERRRLAPILDLASRASAAREIALLTAAPRATPAP